MSPHKRIIDYHLARLSDKRDVVRLEAIHELELLQAVEALDALQAIFQNDPSLEVRKAAQEAGRLIFANKRKQEIG